jgi:uncharacterized protein with HEPN domain
MKNRDEMVLNTLISTIGEVDECIKRFDCKTYEQFAGDNVLKRTIVMCLISLSENVDLLTQNFKDRFSYIDFKAFKSLRNIAAHKYGSVNFEMVWKIANKDLPEYKTAFERALRKHLAAGQNSSID